MKKIKFTFIKRREKSSFFLMGNNLSGLIFYCALTIVLASFSDLQAEPVSSQVKTAIETAHESLWTRSIKQDGIILNFTGRDGNVAIPTPEECAKLQPNGLAWGTPVSDGAFFTGLYLSAMCERYRRTHSENDKNHARQLVRGLLLLAGVSDVTGFIARGVGSDGKSHYPIGSDDQTHPWFFGLYCYLQSGIPDGDEKSEIKSRMVTVANALRQNRWSIPCDSPFKGSSWSSFSYNAFRDATRLLFIQRVMYEITGDSQWLRDYQAAAREVPRGGKINRAGICASGILFDEALIPWIRKQPYIVAGAQASLVVLARLETDEELKSAFRQGIEKTAVALAPVINDYRKFDNAAEIPCPDLDWRSRLIGIWKPQTNTTEAYKIGQAIFSLPSTHPRFMENELVMQPLAAAYIVALAGGETFSASRSIIEAALCHYDYRKLYMSGYLFAECTYYAIPE